MNLDYVLGDGGGRGVSIEGVRTPEYFGHDLNYP